ncbi:hypothetical protein ASD12_18250 [Mesorhizobium sp. Root102]|uniref:hypothetical protein n=1 Tax=Mesorhizobium sp. Root102 TaxID=1736422 RepID=UPI0006FA1881|nr:hypothetical protein [Mesorhizobium sp. Root102]KQU77742.1 hypothetical protein ASD12_18250 [Mesorhizobium sp. Root102]
MAKKTLAELEHDLLAAKQIYEDRQKITSAAHNEETDALNKLNIAQKAFRSQVDDMLDSMPRDSDWHRQLNERFA